MTNVFIISEGDDVGGVGIAIKRAFDRYGGSGWSVRHMRGTNNYIDYPMDLKWDRDLFEKLYEWADVIHSMEKIQNLLAYYNPIGKPLIVHHHGSIYRDNYASFVESAKKHRYVQLASTLDLVGYDPGVTWLPNPIDIRWMEHIRDQYRPSKEYVPRYIHSPTQRWAKHSDQFIRAFRSLGIKLSIMEFQPWSASLAVRAKHNVYADQLGYGYGLAGLESMAMGLPVLGGTLNAEWTGQKLLDVVGYLPYYDAGSDTQNQIAAFHADRNLQDEVAARGNQYVNDFHSQERVVENLKEIYVRAIDEYEVEDKWI